MLPVAKYHVNAKNVCLLCPVCSVWWSLKYQQCTLALGAFRRALAGRAHWPSLLSARAAHANVPPSTLHHRARGRRSREAKAQSQHTLGQPVRMKYVASLAFSATRHRARADRPQKPPGVNWAKAIKRCHPEIKELQNVPLKNVYNMDETRVMLSMPNSVKVLVGKEEMRGSCRGARVKRTTVTAIECISADGRCLNPIIIWPASTH
ncbi:hypothetical protein HBH70_022500 [Parastagonospora nodorum]|nr:hypothetical protein HBH47_011710 [Parastagonospora nodorum]KAH4238338.1 hypothetical protein HBI06_043620 [Parastagonospora nodorum]KAH4250760.1 hypothetical protein HBI03_235070 [Parastagonospora nodorum]KAH4282603.1 hypothetical protein HBI04_033730 [Parastagonospora nodorum]KAH4821673.1 hypothetical protein HBH61_021390 [Parastagonospora nodorum]